MPVYDPSTHDDLINVTVTQAALSSGRASFTQLALLVNGVSPGGGTIASYTTLAEVVADIANLNTIAQSMATAIFGQTNQKARPNKIYIQGVDVSGGQTYVQALDAAITSGADIYGVLADVRTPATQVALATDIETKAASGTYLLFITQDDDADWLTTGQPTAWADVDDYERTVIVYHDDNDADASSDRADCALAGNRLAWDPDETSVGWTCDLVGVDALTTALTAAQKGYARTNCANVALPMGTVADYWIDPGQNQAGRPVDHIVTGDWLRARLREAIADAIVAASSRGQKLTVDLQGQGILFAVITAVFEQAVDAGHLTTTDEDSPIYRVTPQAITSADIAAQRLRFTAEAQVATGVRTITLPIYLSADALAA